MTKGKLITCDLICLGVASPGVFSVYLNWLGKKLGSAVVEYHHRGAHAKMGEYEELAVLENGARETNRTYMRVWKRLWPNVLLRPSCYKCGYHSTNRPGNLSIGDYWGLEQVHPGAYDEKGVSVILVNDNLGSKALCDASGWLKLIESELNRCSNEFQPMLSRPPRLGADRKDFWNAFYDEGFTKACKTAGALGFVRTLKDLIKDRLPRNRERSRASHTDPTIWSYFPDSIEGHFGHAYPLAYAAKHASDEVRSKSSSGGVYFALAESVIKQDGVVYGCAFNESHEAQHIRCSTLEECKKCMGSKYSQSQLSGIVESIVRDLSEGKTVLFTGTPCQVDAVKNACKQPSGFIARSKLDPDLNDEEELPGSYVYRNGEKIEKACGYHPHKSTRYMNWANRKVEPDKLPELYSQQSECCGCTICTSVCPTQAIKMILDEEGFEYPVVDAGKCIACQKCLKACSFKSHYKATEHLP